MIRPIRLVVLLALPVGAAGATSGPPVDDPRTVTATLQVPAPNLLFSADGPDEFGGFDLLIKARGLQIEVTRCEGRPGVLAQMGDVTNSADSTVSKPNQKAATAAQTRYFHALKAARDAGRTVTLHLVGSATYLFRRGAKLVFPYCSINLEPTELTP